MKKQVSVFSFVVLAFSLVCVDMTPAQLRAVDTKQPVDWLSDAWKSNGTVNWNIASVLGLLSKTAYEDDNELMGFIGKGMGFNSCQSFKGANSAAHVLIGDRAIVVAFRGTEFSSFADWQTDFYIRFFNDARLGNLHSGFNTAYENVRVDIENLLRQHPDKQLWVTGHSLGGAMAVICAARCKLDRVNENARIVTFGQPRIGDARVAEWLDNNFPNTYQRFVNDNDAVPRLPFSTFSFPYSDAGRYVMLDRGYFRNARTGFVGNSAGSGVGVETAPPAEVPNQLLFIQYDVQRLPQLQGFNGQASNTGGPTVISSRQTAAVYQSPEAGLPMDYSELEELIQQERDMRAQQRLKMSFPNSIDSVPAPLPAVGSTGGVGNTNSVVGNRWLSTEKITDHYMSGYLKVIRGLRN